MYLGVDKGLLIWVTKLWGDKDVSCGVPFVEFQKTKVVQQSSRTRRHLLFILAMMVVVVESTMQ